MFKNFSHIVLSFLLLFATTGMAVSKHFCGEHLIATTFYTESESCCDAEGCCHNESKFFQIDEDYSAPDFSHAPQVVGLELLFAGTGEYFNFFNQHSFHQVFTGKEPPPPLKTQTVLSLEQVYRL